jgi:hypothetical protein
MLLITQQRYTVSLLKTMHKHYFKLLQEQFYCTVSARYVLSKTRASSALSDIKDESAARVFYI